MDTSAQNTLYSTNIQTANNFFYDNTNSGSNFQEGKKRSVSKQQCINDTLRLLTNAKQLKGLMWEAKSPRFQIACKRLGIDPQTELIIRDLEDFDKGSIEKEIAEMRYKHHLNRVKDTLNKIITERLKIKESYKNEYEDDSKSLISILGVSSSKTKLLTPSYNLQNLITRNQILSKNPSLLKLTASVSNKERMNRNQSMSRATSHAQLISNRSQVSMAQPVGSVFTQQRNSQQYGSKLRQHNYTTVESPSLYQTPTQIQKLNILDNKNQLTQSANQLVNPNIIFRDLKVKILRQKESENILVKHQEKLKKSKENRDYQEQSVEERRKKQQEIRLKHSERYQSIMQTMEDKSVQQYKKHINETRNGSQGAYHKKFKTYQNNSPNSNYSRLNHSHQLSQNGRPTDFELFQISYKQQQERIQRILDNSTEMNKLRSIEHKLQRSTENYESEISQKRQRLHDRNKTQEERFRQISETKRQQQEQIFIKVHSNQYQMHLRSQEREKEFKEMQELKIQAKLEQQQKLLENKKLEEQSSKMKINTLLSRFEKAEQHRQELKQQVEYQMRIKHERRKLKEDDSIIIQSRTKRQRANQKMQILLRQNEHEQNLLLRQAQEEEMRRIKKEMEMKMQIEKQKLKNSITVGVVLEEDGNRVRTDSRLKALESKLPFILRNQNELSTSKSVYL